LVAKKSWASQFKKGTVPNQPIDPGSMVKRANSDSNAKSKSRKGLGLGTMQQAAPGLAMRSSFGVPKKKKRKS
jgi:hypothetical protein